MTATGEKLKNALVWYDWAVRLTLDAIAALVEATDFDADPAERHRARDVAKIDIWKACRALEQAQAVQTVSEADE